VGELSHPQRGGRAAVVRGLSGEGPVGWVFCEVDEQICKIQKTGVQSHSAPGITVGGGTIIAHKNGQQRDLTAGKLTRTLWAWAWGETCGFAEGGKPRGELKKSQPKLSAETGGAHGLNENAHHMVHLTTKPSEQKVKKANPVGASTRT